MEVQAPTQSKRPWHATARSIFQALVGLAAMLPLIVDAAGVDDTLPALAGALAVAAGITRIMAIPQVDAWLARFVPFLAADPGGASSMPPP